MRSSHRNWEGVRSPAEVLEAALLERRRTRLAAIERRLRLEAAESKLCDMLGGGHRGRIEGLAAPFISDSVLISHRDGAFIEQFAPGAFAHSIAEAAGGRGDIFVTWDHLDHIVCGSTASRSLRLWEGRDGLRFVLTPEVTNRAGQLALRSEWCGVSVKFSSSRYDWRSAAVRRRIVFEARLIEISLISRGRQPAYAATWATVRTAGS